MRRPIEEAAAKPDRARGNERDAQSARYSPGSSGVRLQETFEAVGRALAELPASDNSEGAVEKLLRANAILRQLPWPSPFDETTHRVRCGDARDLSWIPAESVHLVVTSPPYWTLKAYEPREAQLGAISEYETFLSELDRAWAECVRVLVPGGRICCVVGDVCSESTRKGHPAPFPVALAERLIKLFSFVGDMVLDPFAGTGTTALAALACGRNSISVDVEPKYVAMAQQRLREAVFLPMPAGAVRTKLEFISRRPASA
jgi:hypothetical protein